MTNLNLELQEVIHEVMDIYLSVEDLNNLELELGRENDFNIELDGKEFRFISEKVIDRVYYDEQRELIEEIYLGGKELPWWIEIDWENTIENVLTSDGYGTHFSCYDHSEDNIIFENENWFIFRTN